MKKCKTCKKGKLLSFPIILAASQGDVEAISQVLEHYEGYIITLSTRTLYDENGAMQRIPKTINKKRLVRYKEGAEMYSMGMNKFQSLAKDVGAILKIDRMVLVDLDVFEQYLESFRVK